MFRIRRRLGVVFACVSAVASAQTSPAPVPTFHTHARTVVVDVVVTGHDGTPATGLHRDAFHVIEAGQMQTVNFFEEHTGAPPAAPAPQQTLPPNVFSNLMPASLPEAVNVLLLDSLNTPMQDQSYVRAQAVKYLRSLKPGTRLAIFTLSTHLGFVQGFTSDPAQLMEAVAGNAHTGPQNSPLLKTQADVSDEQTQVEMMERVTGAAGSASVTAFKRFMADTDAAMTDDRVALTLRNLEQLARLLRSVPGRKNVIWMSGAFPLDILPDDELARLGSASPVRQYADDIRKTTDLLTEARVSLYPVDAHGLQVDSIFDAQAPALDPSVPVATQQARMRNKNDNQRLAEHATMDQMAKGTGGRAFYNTNALGAAMSAATDAGAHFYTLSYTPANDIMDGKFRRIEVKVDGGNYTLAYRRGYYADEAAPVAPASKAAPNDPLKAFMGLGMPTVNQIHYKVLVRRVAQTAEPAAAGAPAPSKRPVVQYAMVIVIDTANLQFSLAPDGTHTGAVYLSLYA